VEYLHAEIVEGGGGGGGDPEASAKVAALQERVQERDRLNATLEREIMELQGALRVKEADLAAQVDAARAEGAAAGADALRHGEERQKGEMTALHAKAAEAEAEVIRAKEGTAQLRAKVDELTAALAAAAEDKDAAKAAAREQELAARVRDLEATLEQRDASLAGLKRALEAQEGKAEAAREGSGAEEAELRRQVQRLEAELTQEKVSGKNTQIFLQTRIEQLTTQLELSTADEDDKSTLKHLQADNDRLQGEIDSLKALHESTKRELDLVQRPAGDSFEEVMVDELRTMRETFEAKLNAVNENAKEKQVAHRRELRELKEAHEKDRAAMESRINYLNNKVEGSQKAAAG